MIGIVVVSHSEPLAKGIVHLVQQMAPDAFIEPAGGLEDGSLGTSYEKIFEAISSMKEKTPDGVLVTVDLGSGVMTTEMVIEDLGDDNVLMADCPLVEGTFVAAINAPHQKDVHILKQEAEETWNQRKTTE